MTEICKDSTSLSISHVMSDERIQLIREKEKYDSTGTLEARLRKRLVTASASEKRAIKAKLAELSAGRRASKPSSAKPKTRPPTSTASKPVSRAESRAAPASRQEESVASRSVSPTDVRRDAMLKERVAAL
ncbi:hypothetical protein KIPB_008537 [Kipferlia bialata]|uniref:Uncharacterized protein n=1 Tax=Kipferlia bialata TaxID=797122 RepID=A0A9K3D221_9EUKA|nr:hypothetical protein KIPB_008537 [Kipferlia bialata]|eukprot:g8537.t1